MGLRGDRGNTDDRGGRMYPQGSPISLAPSTDPGKPWDAAGKHGLVGEGVPVEP